MMDILDAKVVHIVCILILYVMVMTTVQMEVMKKTVVCYNGLDIIHITRITLLQWL